MATKYPKTLTRHGDKATVEVYTVADEVKAKWDGYVEATPKAAPAAAKAADSK